MTATVARHGSSSSLIVYRCSVCYQELTASVGDAHWDRACEHCGSSNRVPEATPDRVCTEAEYRSRSATVAAVSSAPAVSFNDLGPEQLGAFTLDDLTAGMSDDPTRHAEPLAGLDAPISTRFWAAVVDGLIIMGLVLLAATYVGTLELTAVKRFGRELAGEIDRSPELVTMYLQMGIATAMAMLHCPVQWALLTKKGQTIGKMLFGIRVVGRGGGRVGFFRAVVLRNWLRRALNLIPLFGVFDCAFLMDGGGRCLHDYIAGTRVIRARAGFARD